MFTQLEVEKTSSSNYLLNTNEVTYEEFIDRLSEIVGDQQKEIEHFQSFREIAEKQDMKNAAAHYARKYLEISEKMMNNIDTMEMAEKLKDSVVFLMTGAVPTFVYLGKKKKVEYDMDREDLKLLYG